jgi:uncharacterized protein YkwD
MGRTIRYALVALVGLILVLGAWAISVYGSRLNITELHFTTFSGAAPAPATSTSLVSTPTLTSTPTSTSASAPTPTAGSGKPTPPPGTTSQEKQIAQAVFQAINSDRADAGLPALQWGDALDGGAHKHNLLMSNANQLSHQLPGEPGIGERVTQDGVKWTWCGENIGYTSDTTTNGALGLHKLMINEKPPDDGHRQNILSTNYTMVGVNIYIDSHHQLWLTEDFAN